MPSISLNQFALYLSRQCQMPRNFNQNHTRQRLHSHFFSYFICSSAPSLFLCNKVLWFTSNDLVCSFLLNEIFLYRPLHSQIWAAGLLPKTLFGVFVSVFWCLWNQLFVANWVSGKCCVPIEQPVMLCYESLMSMLDAHFHNPLPSMIFYKQKTLYSM